MRLTDDRTEAAWKSEVKAGDNRPVVRATVQRMHMGRFPYNTEDAPGHDYDHKHAKIGNFRSWVFGSGGAPREIPNLRKADWSRSVDQDVATCNLTIANTQLVPIGAAQGRQDEFEQPGYLTFSRGDTNEYQDATQRYGYTTNAYFNLLRPDRIVRTYEGYGADYSVAPGDDPNLYISGTWLVDDVTYDANGDIVLEMRDMGRLLMDHISFPPIVPYNDYPLEWSRIRTETTLGRAPTGGSYKQPAVVSVTSSNNLYVNRNIEDTPKYVQRNGSVMGHSNRAPVTKKADDYWLSTGQSDPNDFVWWQENFRARQNVSSVKLQMVGGPYKVYISLWDADKQDWIGRKSIPYKAGSVGLNPNTESGGEVSGVDIGGNIAFVQDGETSDGKPIEIVLKRRYGNITKVRVTVTSLREQAGVNYPFRAGIRKVWVYTGVFDNLDFDKNGKVKKNLGNYRDFTDIVRWVTAWCGFYWPTQPEKGWQRFKDSVLDNDKTYYDFPGNDGVLVKGRVWGTLEQTGTGGVAEFDATMFDKQPLMNVIQSLREIVPFSFWIDESGGVVWRRANIDSSGNYITRHHKQTRLSPIRALKFVTVTESDVLLGYQTRLSSKNIRERIFIGDANGKIGSVVRGYEPIPHTGMRRVAGWLDKNWKTKAETQIMGDLTAERQLYDYRRSKWTICGNPAIQVDDQVNIVERVTNEDFTHYVLGISSSLDMEEGTWTYQMESHWLGQGPGQYVGGRKFRSNVTQHYLDAVGGEK